MKIIGYDYDGRLSVRNVKTIEVTNRDRCRNYEKYYRIIACYMTFSHDSFYIDKGPIEKDNFEKRLCISLSEANQMLSNLLSFMNNDIIDLRETGYVLTSGNSFTPSVYVMNDFDSDFDEEIPLLVKSVS